MAGESTGAPCPGASNGANTDANTVCTMLVGACSGTGTGATVALAGTAVSTETGSGAMSWTAGSGCGATFSGDASAPSVERAGATESDFAEGLSVGGAATGTSVDSGSRDVSAG